MCPLANWSFSEVVEVPVDYGDTRNTDLNDFFNVNPRLDTVRLFPAKTGLGVVTKRFRFMRSDSGFTTGEALQAITDNGYRNPDFVETRAFDRVQPDSKQGAPIESFCGLLHDQDGFQFIAYIHMDASGLSAFFNWLGFKRKPTVFILVVDETSD